MQILKGNSIDWRERRLLSKLAWISVTTGPREDKECGDFKRRCTNMIHFIDFFKWYCEYLTNENREGFGDFKKR
jgi:hypothetical protein